MSNKVHHIAVLIDCDKERAIHWFELFKHIDIYLKSKIYFVVWNPDIADIARSLLDVDKIHLISRSFLKMNDYRSINFLIQQYKIEKCIEIGGIPKFVRWKLNQNNILNRIKVSENIDITDNKYYSFIIYLNHTAKVNYNKNIACTPFPNVNYKNFLDLNTQVVLDIKQNIGLISYDNQIIKKAFVCGHAGDLTTEFIRYLEYNNCEWYDVITEQGSFILSPNLSNNLPIVYELLDCIVVNGELDDIIQYHILNAMASGTIVIAPRHISYQELLGRGALYYNPNSSSELAACVDIIQKNENKKLMIRAFASEQFQRKYSYQAIAQFWANLLAKI